MALQNIGASNKNDAFYRYKMPKLVTKIEGRGNGVKTNLVNMVDVAKALARPPSYTTKYFGCELGAQSKFDEKTGTAIVNGSHDSFKLVGLLENFIKKYVQCYECGNPETEIVITKTQLVILKCAACGFLSDVDMRDKLTTFILKNPPEQKKKNDKKGMRRAEKERMKEGEALDEEMKRAKKETRRKKSHEGIANGQKKKGSGSESDEHSPSSSQADETEDHPPVEEEEVQWQTDTSAEAVQQRIKEQLTSATSEMVMLDISTKSENATIKHEKSLPKSILPEKLEAVCKVKEDHMPLSAFDKLVKDLRGSLDRGCDASELAAQLQVLQCQSSEQEVMNACFEALFGGIKKGLAKDIGRKKSFLSKVISGEHSQELLLGAVEAYYLSRPLELRKEVASVLKHLYDLDVLEEDVILNWYDRSSDAAASQLKKMAEPFVEWLKTAESEDDE